MIALQLQPPTQTRFPLTLRAAKTEKIRNPLPPIPKIATLLMQKHQLIVFPTPRSSSIENARVANAIQRQWHLLCI